MSKPTSKKPSKTARLKAPVELHPDAQRRFEKAVDIALHTKPAHKTKPKG